MKRAALYMRVSTLDQHPETQLYDLVILMGMLIVAGFAFAIGWALNAESHRHRTAHDQISDRLWRIHMGTDSHERQLKDLQTILSEIRTQILAVAKGLEKPLR